MSASERFVEFGVMRTNGWTRRNILVLVTTESALLGLLSGALGCLLGAAAVFAVNRVLTGFALDLRPGLLATSLAAATAIALASGLYPAWRASTMTPMDAIRFTALRASRPSAGAVVRFDRSSLRGIASAAPRHQPVATPSPCAVVPFAASVSC